VGGGVGWGGFVWFWGGGGGGGGGGVFCEAKKEPVSLFEVRKRFTKKFWENIENAELWGGMSVGVGGKKKGRVFCLKLRHQN